MELPEPPSYPTVPQPPAPKLRIEPPPPQPDMDLIDDRGIGGPVWTKQDAKILGATVAVSLVVLLGMAVIAWAV